MSTLRRDAILTSIYLLKEIKNFTLLVKGRVHLSISQVSTSSAGLSTSEREIQVWQRHLLGTSKWNEQPNSGSSLLGKPYPNNWVCKCIQWFCELIRKGIKRCNLPVKWFLSCVSQISNTVNAQKCSKPKAVYKDTPGKNPLAVFVMD